MIQNCYSSFKDLILKAHKYQGILFHQDLQNLEARIRAIPHRYNIIQKEDH